MTNEQEQQRQRELQRIRSQRFRQRNPNKYRENNRINNQRYRKRNPNKYRESVTRWKKQIKDKYGLGVGTIREYGFSLALKIYERYERKCAYCGSEYDLTIHHLDRRGRNFANKGLKPNNSEENLILICRRCHGSIHGKQAKGKPKKSLRKEE